MKRKEKPVPESSYVIKKMKDVKGSFPEQSTIFVSLKDFRDQIHITIFSDSFLS